MLSAAVVKLKFTLIPVFWLFKDKMKANIVDIHCENKPLKAQSFHAEEGDIVHVALENVCSLFP